MMRRPILNRETRALLAEHDVTVREWAQEHHGIDDWRGSPCGCPDDCCAGHHHDEHDDCGCLHALLDEYTAARATTG